MWHVWARLYLSRRSLLALFKNRSFGAEEMNLPLPRSSFGKKFDENFDRIFRKEEPAKLKIEPILDPMYDAIKEAGGLDKLLEETYGEEIRKQLR